jgi:large subunit ribosomal protein L25
MISLEQKVVSSLANTPSVFSKVYTLALDGKKESVIAKDIQLNPITDEPIHIDFMRVDSSSEIHISVPIVFINEDKSPGLKKGGVLNVVLHSLEIVAKLDAIPEKITVDLSGVEASQSITLDKLNLSTNVKASHPERDHVIATIVAASNQESSEA